MSEAKNLPPPLIEWPGKYSDQLHLSSREENTREKMLHKFGIGNSDCTFFQFEDQDDSSESVSPIERASRIFHEGRIDRTLNFYQEGDKRRWLVYDIFMVNAEE